MKRKIKAQATVDFIIEEMQIQKADGQIFIVGIGGEVVREITGFVASI